MAKAAPIIVIVVGLLSLCTTSQGFRLGGFLSRFFPEASTAVSRLTTSDDFEDGDDPSIKHHWALLIAGSNGWGNYRHQADVCHAYQVLRKGGLSPARIIVMMYDDIANNIENPHPGKIFNRPGGPDVYHGVPKDYTGKDVNAANFLNVLAGNAEALAGIGSGRVVKSGPSDRVFVFYSDHGAAGVLGMPSGPFLYADQFIETLNKKADSQGFKELVMYIEACESGSMFEGLLDESRSIYVTTAANAFESSWATYCPGMDGMAGEFNTCLGDLYSVAWMENSDLADLTKETLEKQYELVKLRTSNNYTYMMGSHVMQYGALDIDKELAGDYIGMNNTAGLKPSEALASNRVAPPPAHATVSLPQREADVLPHMLRYVREASAGGREAARDALSRVLSERQLVDRRMRDTVRQLLSDTSIVETMVLEPSAGTGGIRTDPNDAVPQVNENKDDLVELLMSKSLSGTRGAPLVSSWSCLREMVAAWEAACGPLGQYGMRHTRGFANLCNAGLSPFVLKQVLTQKICAKPGTALAGVAKA